MEISEKEASLAWKVLCAMGGGIAAWSVRTYRTGVKLKSHEKRISNLETGKVDKTDCGAIQDSNTLKFEVGAEQFSRLENLIKEIKLSHAEANRTHQKHHDDVMKILIEKL